MLPIGCFPVLPGLLLVTTSSRVGPWILGEVPLFGLCRQLEWETDWPVGTLMQVDKHHGARLAGRAQVKDIFVSPPRSHGGCWSPHSCLEARPCPAWLLFQDLPSLPKRLWHTVQLCSVQRQREGAAAPDRGAKKEPELQSCYNLVLGRCGQERLDIHRLFAMNSPRCLQDLCHSLPRRLRELRDKSGGRLKY